MGSSGHLKVPLSASMAITGDPSGVIYGATTSFEKPELALGLKHMREFFDDCS
jgi:hypothetical protein